MGKQEKYYNPFPSRLRKLIDEHGITITALAKELKITRQAVSQYTDGSAQPNIEKLVSIANFFNVSADYLVGLSEYERHGTEALTAKSMGISNAAAVQLEKNSQKYGPASGVVINILAQTPKFWDFTDAVTEYVRAVNHAREWSNTIEGIYREKKNIKIQKYLVSEALFDVLNDSCPIPNFDEREKEAQKRETKENAIDPKADN